MSRTQLIEASLSDLNQLSYEELKELREKCQFMEDVKRTECELKQEKINAQKQISLA